MTNSRGLARVYERALRFHHVHGGSRDHEGSMNAVQSRCQTVWSGHIALDDFNSRDLSSPVAFALFLTNTRTGTRCCTNSFAMKEPAEPVAPVSSSIEFS